MAQVPEIQQIVSEDFSPEDQDVATKIGDSFNTYTEQLNEALNKNLTFSENFRGAVKTFSIKGDASLTFRYDTKEKPIGLWIVSYSNQSNPAEVLSVGVSPQWSFDGKGNITLQRIGGLTPADTYLVTLIAVSG